MCLLSIQDVHAQVPQTKRSEQESFLKNIRAKMITVAREQGETYTPTGPSSVKILTANRFCGVPGPGSYQTPKPDGSAPMLGMQTSKRVNSIFLMRNSFMRILYSSFEEFWK